MNTNLAMAAAALNKPAATPKPIQQTQRTRAANQTPQPVTLAEQQQAWGHWQALNTLTRKTLSTFAFEIKTKRKQKGLTQRELAMRTTISQTTISRAERGYGEISLETAISIIHALGQNCTLTDNN